ncbi:MAG TPA: TIGR04372 family glycosyltransferase [Chlamydiales bacterium]|nr:TIGR04372 family glycosyltransferase [Chlamydiales bacterium]
MAFPDIIFDAGISRLKWQLPKKRKYKEFDRGASYLHQISKEEGLARMTEYYRKLKRSPEKFPLKETSFADNRLKELVSIDGKKVALIHVKDIVRNAIALPTDPNTYLGALKYLRNSGYCLIFVGREKMPPIFKQYGIVNYAESEIADFYHDLHLFSIAEIALISASGISVLADCMDVPYLYLNSWHLSVPPFSKKSISIPALMKRSSGGWVSFAEQNRIYKTLADVGPENFPHGEYIPRNASEEEILMAVKELEALKNTQTSPPLTTLQSQFKYLDPASPLFYAESRCCDFFLLQHKALCG